MQGHFLFVTKLYSVHFGFEINSLWKIVTESCSVWDILIILLSLRPFIVWGQKET